MGAGHAHTSHDHSHGSAGRRKTSQKKLMLVLLLVVVFMIVEFVGGLISGSLALMADAGHMFSDAAALGLSLFAMAMAKKPPTATRTYGYYRIEILAALFNGATLIAIAIFIVKEAYERLHSPQEIQAPLMMGIAAAGLAVNLAGLMILHSGRSASLNVKGAYLHVLGDALGSVGALLAGGAVWLFGWQWADPVVSAVIAALILFSSWNLVWQAVGVLMEGTPGGIDVDEVRSAIAEIDGVEAVHDLHVWSITSGMDSLSAHVVCNGTALDAPDWSDLLNTVRTIVHDRFGIDHVTIQLEPADYRADSTTGACTDCQAADQPL